VLYAQDDNAAVSGVKAGERVVLDGRQNVRPGSTLVERAREGGGRASGAAGGAASGAASGSAGRAASGASGAAAGLSKAAAP